MPEAKTYGDAVRVYLTGDPSATTWSHAASIGGARLPVEVGQGFSIEQPIPGLFIELVSCTKEGIAYLYGTAGQLQFKAPTDTAYGTAVSIAVGETKILQSYNTSLGYIRVTNIYADVSFSGTAELSIRDEMENVIAHSASITTGKTTYSAVIVKNVSTETLTSLWFRCGYAAGAVSIGVETPDANGSIQLLSNNTTAPIGVTFLGYQAPITITNIKPDQSIGVWIRMVTFAGASVNPSFRVELQMRSVSPTYGSILQYKSGRTRILSTSKSYQLFSGDGVIPDFSATPSDSGASFPLTVSITPPTAGTKTIYLTTRETNTGGLQSLNQYAHPITIDTAGDIVIEPLHPPSNTVLSVQENCLVLVQSEYITGFDNIDADQFKIWITDTGIDPDPDDTPTAIVNMLPDGVLSNYYLSEMYGPYDHASDVKVLIRSYRSSDSVESNNIDIYTIPMTTTLLYSPDQPQSLLSTLIAEARSVLSIPSFEIVESAAGNIHWVIARGQSRFYFDEECAFVISDGKLKTQWAIGMGAVSGAAARDGVECIDENTVYFACSKTRAMKLDNLTKTITIVSMDNTVPASSLCVGPIYITTSLIQFQCWSSGVWRTVASLDNTGKLKMGLENLVMCDSDLQLFS